MVDPIFKHYFNNITDMGNEKIIFFLCDFYGDKSNNKYSE